MPLSSIEAGEAMKVIRNYQNKLLLHRIKTAIPAMLIIKSINVQPTNYKCAM